jgi:hypothetical protein
VWANHADAIAQAYGGSGALKSDFTRTNKRTKKGILEDGVKGSLRYLKNNYFDGPRQVTYMLYFVHSASYTSYHRMVLICSLVAGFPERIHHLPCSSLRTHDPCSLDR